MIAVIVRHIEKRGLDLAALLEFAIIIWMLLFQPTKPCPVTRPCGLAQFHEMHDV